jgi:catechol 2,3-dioxygenase-like lactoylglutathione lyase family enzyme
MLQHLSRFIIVLNLVTATSSFADQRTANWTGPYSACRQRSELLKHGAMDIGVRFSTSNPELELQFRRALDFWTEILDLRWHEDNSESCSLQLVDGTPEILQRSIVARSQFPDWDNFQGWIAFNPAAPLTHTETFLTAVHEIGHILGLKHNPNSRSVMYYLDLEGSEYLDEADLILLGSHHKLRSNVRPGMPVLRTEVLSTMDGTVFPSR